MYHLLIDKNLQIIGVSTKLKNDLHTPSHTLKGCFFLSMVDCEVPDVLAEDLIESLNQGKVYYATLKINVFKNPVWQKVTISENYENGQHVGYLVKMVETSVEDLKATCSVYKRMKKGVISILNGFPVTQDLRDNSKQCHRRVR